MKRQYFWSCVIFMFLGCSSVQEEESQALFTMLKSKETGIDFRNDLIEDVMDDGKNINSFEYFFNGAGVAIADFDNDGLLDVFFSANDGDNLIYRNEGDLKFKKLPRDIGINVGKKWSTGVTIVDINKDGFDDIYVCQSGPFTQAWSEKKNLLFINQGDLTFKEQAAEYGLADMNLSTQATFFDYDLDGDLDCFVLNESIYPGKAPFIVNKELQDPVKMDRSSSHLYENVDGKYKKVSKAAGVLRWGFGLGLSVSDINQDGYPDIYVANDYSIPDFMYINQKDGTFKDEVKDYTNQISYFSMGMDVADINNDMLLDIAVVDMAADDHINFGILI